MAVFKVPFEINGKTYELPTAQFLAAGRLAASAKHGGKPIKWNMMTTPKPAGNNSFKAQFGLDKPGITCWITFPIPTSGGIGPSHKTAVVGPAEKAEWADAEASVRASHRRAHAVSATSRRVKYLRRKYGPNIAAQPPKPGTELQSMSGRRLSVKGYKKGRALLSNGTNISMEQLMRDYGWTGKCSIACAIDQALLTKIVNNDTQSVMELADYLNSHVAVDERKWDSLSGSPLWNKRDPASKKKFLQQFNKVTKQNFQASLRCATQIEENSYEQKKSGKQASIRASIGQSYSNLQQWQVEAKRRGLKTLEVTHPSGVGTHWVAKDKDGNRVGEFDPDTNRGKLTADPTRAASVRASDPGSQPSTGSLSLDFPSTDQARAFAQSAMGVDGARVTCSGTKVSVTYPAVSARAVIAAAHRSHGKAVVANQSDIAKMYAVSIRAKIQPGTKTEDLEKAKADAKRLGGIVVTNQPSTGRWVPSAVAKASIKAGSYDASNAELGEERYLEGKDKQHNK